jgi:nucleoside-diphosphate-sugar epimerase
VLALVTGANGFVGSHLVRHLLARGHSVRALVRKSSNLELLDGVAPEFAYGDVTDESGLDDAVAGVDVVFHVAGVIAALDDAGFDRVNLGGTQRMLEAVQRAAPTVRRFVLVSSIAATGPAETDAPRRVDEPARPTSAYGRSKLRAETWLREHAGDVPWTIVRPPIVYGSGDSATLELFASAKRGIAVRLSGPDRPLSVVHVSDLAAGMELCATHDAARGDAFYLCGPEDLPMHEFQCRIAHACGRKPITVPVPAMLFRAIGACGDVVGRVRGRPAVLSSDKVSDALQRSWRVDGSYATERLGFRPQVSVDEGIREALAWYEARGRL